MKYSIQYSIHKEKSRIGDRLATAFLAFLAGTGFGYLWMAHAYGLLP